MKKTILPLLLLTSLTAFAHEDTYKAVEKSNVHIMIQVDYKSSWELRIVEAYAEIINDFIKEIDSTEKVFIHFSEDYCFFNHDLFFIAYGDFKNFVHSEFPWGYNYDMKFINTQKGIGIIISDKFFKLKTLLQFLEFGLRNKNYVVDKGKFFKGKKYESETASIIDSVQQSTPSHLIKKYLSKKIKLQDIPEVLSQKNIELFLQNDSVIFVDNNNTEILKLSTINSISYDKKTDCLFVLNTNYSFYFVNQNLKSNQRRYEIPFKLSCSNWLNIRYVDKEYILEKKSWFSQDNEDWFFFDKINGVTTTK